MKRIGFIYIDLHTFTTVLWLLVLPWLQPFTWLLWFSWYHG